MVAKCIFTPPMNRMLTEIAKQHFTCHLKAAWELSGHLHGDNIQSHPDLRLPMEDMGLSSSSNRKTAFSEKRMSNSVMFYVQIRFKMVYHAIVIVEVIGPKCLV